MHNLISRIRAQINREFALTLHEREMVNAGYFERLCFENPLLVHPESTEKSAT